MADNVYTCVSYIFIHNEIGHLWEFERMFKKKIKSLENESLIFCNQKIFIFVQKLYDMKKLNYSKIMKSQEYKDLSLYATNIHQKNVKTLRKNKNKNTNWEK